MSLEGPTIPLTFAQIAERLGIEVASAKARARRGKWRRMPGNHGRTLVHVPVEILPQYHEATLVELPPKAKPGSELPEAYFKTVPSHITIASTVSRHSRGRAV